MKMSSVVLLLVAATLPLDAQEKKPLRVCLVSGSLEYESDKSLAILQKHLEKTGDVVCSRAFRKTDDNIPGLDNLDTCDLAVFFTRRLTIDGKQLEQVQKYVHSGKPIVGIRTASHGFQKWLVMDKEIFGGNYKGHFGANIPCEVKIVDKSHPIVAGFHPYVSAGSLYKNQDIAKDTHVLLTGTIPGQTEPVAWTREVKGARVFYTSLGHQKDFDEADYLRLVMNGIKWAAKR